MIMVSEIIKEVSPYVSIETFQQLHTEHNIASITSGGKVIATEYEEKEV